MSAEDGEEDSRWSDMAVVGAAFAVEAPTGGIPLIENRDDVEIREALDPGRSGDGTLEVCP